MTLDFRAPLLTRGPSPSARGEILWIDHYGNAITNLRPEDLLTFMDDPTAVTFTVGGVDLGPPRSHYGAGAPGETLVVLGSSGYYEIAVRDASAADRLGLVTGSPVWVRAAP